MLTPFLLSAFESIRTAAYSNRLREGADMERYKNLAGDSGVTAYETGSDFIWVRFSDAWKYLYTYASAGSDNIEHMKRLAANGRGLNSFINATVRKRYARKER